MAYQYRKTHELRRYLAICLVIVLTALLTSCATIGPPTVSRDRLDYISTISKSWKRQVLFNLLQTRYLDTPVFMDISSVISQYSLEKKLNFGFDWDVRNSQSLSGGGVFTDRPTITYTPLTGENFARSLLMPIPIQAIMLLIQSGYSADYVLHVCVQTINGIRNDWSSATEPYDADPEFYQLTSSLRYLQKSGGMLIRSKRSDGKRLMELHFRGDTSHDNGVTLHKVLKLLNLASDKTIYKVVHGGFAENNEEIAILSRSMLQVMTEYASFIDVPDEDIRAGRVAPTHKIVNSESRPHSLPFIKVHSSNSKPDDAFVAVHYHNHWFWINDTDIHSKGMFRFLMLLFSFTEKGDSDSVAPLITVPTN